MSEPCGEHSGIKVLQAEHERRLNEYHNSVVGIHRRMDESEQNLSEFRQEITGQIGEMRDDFTKKLGEYSRQMVDQYAETMKIFSDPKEGVILGTQGLKPRVEALERHHDVVWGVLKWAVPALFTVIAFFREAIGKLMRLIFF